MSIYREKEWITDKPLIVPKIVYIVMALMVMLAVVTGLAYWFESSVLDRFNETPLFDLFSDAFKVGLGAFIGVLSQWASTVFGNQDAAANTET